MSVLGFLHTACFNLGALAVSYVLLLSGVHKYIYKLGGVVLSQDLYRSLDRFYLMATREGYKSLDAFLASHTTVDPSSIPHLHATTIKSLVGGFEILMAFLWMTSRWRSAAWGSILCFLTWITLALTDFLPSASGLRKQGDEESISFAAFFLGLSLFLLYIGPDEIRPARARARPPAAAVAGGAKAKRR